MECMQVHVFAVKTGKPFDTPSVSKIVLACFVNRRSVVRFHSPAPQNQALADCAEEELLAGVITVLASR